MTPITPPNATAGTTADREIRDSRGLVTTARRSRPR
jgi:hypothetical protein